MRAARWHGRGDIRVEDVPEPRPRAGQVLVAVELTGICGSDLEEYLSGPVVVTCGPPHPLSGRTAPLTLGHEVVGTVASCPGGELPLGTRVVPDVVVGCGRCWWCARHEESLCPQLSVRGFNDDGGLAELMLADAATCVVVPDGTPARVAAFAEPTSVAVRALRKAGEVAGATACVVGAGTIGLLSGQILLAAGAARVVAVDPVASRRARATELGMVPSTPEEAAGLLAELTGGRGADVVFECAGVASAMRGSLSLARRGGTVVLLGVGPEHVELSVRSLVHNELRLLGSVAHIWDEDVAAAVALLARGVVDPLPLVSGIVPLEHVVADGFERLCKDRDVLKLLVAPGATPP